MHFILNHPGTLATVATANRTECKIPKLADICRDLAPSTVVKLLSSRSLQIMTGWTGQDEKDRPPLLVDDQGRQVPLARRLPLFGRLQGACTGFS